MKTFTGTVTSTKMDKTVVVEVTRSWTHPTYRKTVKRTKKYLVHDEVNTSSVGDSVNFIETKPYSKLKRFCLVTDNTKTKSKKPPTTTKKTKKPTKKQTKN